MEISAEGAQASEPSNDTHGQALKETIIRRATELRREWSQPRPQPTSVVTPSITNSRHFIAENRNKPSVTNSSHSLPETSNKPLSLLQFLADKQLKIVDKRGSGGFLWVIGGQELAPVMEELRANGVKFTFASNGFSSNQNRNLVYTDGWYVL